jgi:hypothetical protein
LKAAAAAGVSVTLDGEDLVLRAAHEPDLAVVELLRAHKRQIALLLRDAGWSEEDWQALFDERAAILEYDGGIPRAEAEASAAKEVAERRRTHDSSRRAEKLRDHRGHRGRTDG